MSVSPLQLLAEPVAVVEFRGVTKCFGSFNALDSVSFCGHAGTVHAITGENGAGKSTLMKMLAGVYAPDAGELRNFGEPRRWHGADKARLAGISTVFQELTLLPNLTIAENLFLGREPLKFGFIDKPAMVRMARAVLDNIGIALNVKTYCRDLSVGEQHLIEIAKGAAMESRIVIYDEPTAALDSHGVEKLMSLIDAQKKAGKLIFYISHRLDEIFRLCDTVTVLKDGRHVRTCATSELTRESLVSLMVGREVGQLYPARSTGTTDGSAALSVRGLMVGPGESKVSFALRRGEILGLAGLEGQGQRELARTIVGLMPSAGGTVHKLDKAGTEKPLPANAVGVVNSGVGFVPEDRKTEGLYLTLPIRRNMGLGPLRGGALWSRARTEGARIQSLMQEMNIRARSDRQVVSALSGGNQQKVMIGRWLLADVDILVIEEPTRGVDVGAKAEIYRLLRDYASKGGAVLMTSSEMTEHLGLCDRILVVRSGAIVADLEAGTATEEIIARHAFLGANAQDVHP